MKPLLACWMAIVGAVVAGWALPAAATICCVEAESAASVESPMLVVRTDAPPAGIKPVAGVSSNAYLEVPLGVGKPPAVKAGKAVLSIDVPEEGHYTLWLRTYWEGECSNSFLAQMDDHPAFVIGEDATYHSWHWVKYPVSKMTPTFKLTKGVHTLALTHREDGVRVDQVLLSSDRRFVPVGIEQTGVRP